MLKAMISFAHEEEEVFGREEIGSWGVERKRKKREGVEQNRNPSG